VLVSLCALALASPTGWQKVRSPMEHPRYQKLLNQLYHKQSLDKGISRGNRIVGGDYAALGDFPHQIYGYFDDMWLCGGSIISTTFVLTAAHCTYGGSFVWVFIGSINRQYEAPLEVLVSGVNIIQHAGYDDDTIDNDISLLRVPAITFGPTMSAVALPNRADASVVLDGHLAITSGFGVVTDDEPYTSATLMFVETPIMSNALCAQTFGPYVRDTNICKDTFGGRGACGGDSGGPMTTVINGRRVLCGIVSFGAAAGCERNYPAVYVRVTSYLDWIQANTGIIIP